jgi:hypothetical protein
MITKVALKISEYIIAEFIPKRKGLKKIQTPQSKIKINFE